MPQYKTALSIILLAASHQSAKCFVPGPSLAKNMHMHNNPHSIERAASISTMHNDGSSGSNIPMPSLGETVRTVKVAYIDAENDFDDEDDEEDGIVEKAAKKRRVVLDVKNGSMLQNFQVDIPIAESGTSTSVNKIGLSLRQIQDGTLSETLVELDSLRYVSNEEEVIRNQKLNCSYGEEGEDGSIQILNEKEFRSGVDGVIVSSVRRGGAAWELGIRAGDMLVATSATIGEKLWPKSTMEGIRSAITSRRVMSKTMKIEFQRAGDVVGDAELVKEFELPLSRPMGIHIEDTEDGYVQISGFTEDAPDNVTKRLRVGDRIIAVDSSLGSKMWPVSNVEGVVSAVTTRLPGQPVQIRFERVVNKDADLSELQSLDEERKNKSFSSSLLNSYSKFAEKATSVDRSQELLSRCRGVLKRYISVYDSSSERSARVPALVADRVLESLADASASLDAKTLSLIMNAYITCNQPKDALKTFEAAVGLKADGSNESSDVVITGKSAKNKIVPSPSGLNLYTITDAIRAHSMLRDSFSARRLLAAVDGNSASLNGSGEFTIGGEDVKADTKCYNTILAALVNSEDIEAAEEMFNQMCDPDRFPSSSSKKNLATYNIMIGAYARLNKREDAFQIFKLMQRSGVKPDKITITSLIKAAVKDGDFEVARSLLSGMRKAGIEADVVAYNTVIRALCEKSSWFEAKELVADMESNGVNPDSKTYGLLMNGLLKLNKPGPCLTLFESACADQRTAGLMETVQLYTTAITAAASLGDSDRAFELVSRMNFAGVKPNLKTTTALMGACISDGKHEVAIDVYNKMKMPDGYARTLAIRAYCASNEFETALSMIQDEDELTGKQIMLSYNYMLESALNKKYYRIAEDIMENLLQRGFIPSKKTLQIICNSLELFPKKSLVKNTEDGTGGNEKMKFLLGMVDSFDKRKLQFSGQFYAGILSEGERMGGLEKRIASLLTQSKTDASHRSVNVDYSTTNSGQKPKQNVSWIQFLDEYSQWKDRMDEIVLPVVRVKITEREVRQVLFAERGVSYFKRRTKQTRPKIKQ